MPSSLPDFGIRAARIEDARAIAEVQIRVRMSTYRGLVPDPDLDSLPDGIEERVRKWRDRLSEPGNWRTLVVHASTEEVVGFCLFGPLPHREGSFTGYVDIIYLLKEHQRRGVGGSLLRAAARLLAGDGHRTLYLWVHARNDPARHFYEKLGGHPIETRRLEVHGRDRDEVAYGWDEEAFGRLLKP